MQINNLGLRLGNGILRFFAEKQNLLTGLARGIPNLSQLLFENQQKLDDRLERLNQAFKTLLLQKHNQIERAALRPYYILNILEKKQENFLLS